MNKYLMTLGLLHDLSLDFKRLGKKISEIWLTYTDNPFAGTIIFLTLLFLSFAFIKAYTKK